MMDSQFFSSERQESTMPSAIGPNTQEKTIVQGSQFDSSSAFSSMKRLQEPMCYQKARFKFKLYKK